MGGPAPSLHRESTDSLIIVLSTNTLLAFSFEDKQTISTSVKDSWHCMMCMKYGKGVKGDAMVALA